MSSTNGSGLPPDPVPVDNPPYLARKGTATQLIVRGKPFIMLAGELENYSASHLPFMENLWPRLAAMHVNTVLAPLYWEFIEPEEDHFDFGLLEGLLDGARRHGLHLVFLWFGTWKNSESIYAPPWVRIDLGRFPRMQAEPGVNTHALSCFDTEACRADAKAFAAVMRHIRQLDEKQHTVLMMQVENEIGVLGASRDHSPGAEAAFAQDVPHALVSYLAEHRDKLIPEFDAVWAASGYQQSGTWSELFDNDAGEIFMAWNIGCYVEQVAVAGKAEYDLPMFVNAWLKGDKAGQYPSGGPMPMVSDVWRAAAPHIDALAPDIYSEDFAHYCEAYCRPGNPFLIPEVYPFETSATAVFSAIGNYDAMMFSPYALDRHKGLVPESKNYDQTEGEHPIAASYAVLAEMMPLLTACQGTGRMKGFFQQTKDQEWRLTLGGCRLRVVACNTMEQHAPMAEFQGGFVPGGGLIISSEDDEFYVVGRNLFLEFHSACADRPNAEALVCDEGAFRGGTWVPGPRIRCQHYGRKSVIMWCSQSRITVRRLKLHFF